MAILIGLIVFGVLTAIIGYFGYHYYARPGRVYEQLGGPATFAMPSVDRVPGEEKGLLVTVIEQIGNAVPASDDDISIIRTDLIAAGYRAESAVAVYVGLRIISAVSLLALSLVLRTFISNPILSIILPIGATCAGYWGPSFVLDYLVGARQERIRYGLPDALDLLTVAVEAGLGLDQALQYVGNELVDAHPDVATELGMVTLEIRGGKRRVDALRALSDRTGESEMRKLVAVLIQTDRFGTSIADSLRAHSDFMRTRRRQEAEERAGKVGVKLVFPIFFLILPSMVVVVAGPGLLQVFKYLIPMMRSFHA